jgi:Tn3 transposase DDE domain
MAANFLQKFPFSEECSRLITNCIVFYNVTILSQLLAHKESAGDTQGAILIKQVSPIAWQHINLYGRYEFIKRLASINLNKIIQMLAKVPEEEYYSHGACW